MNASDLSPAARLIAPAGAADAKPLWLARDPAWVERAALSPAQLAWVAAQGFKGQPRKQVLIPDASGALAGAVIG
ncbi:hypothetical protein ABTE45_19155, partial [Acinetobacter baumannii]